MSKKAPKKREEIPTGLIAPCGMNCRLCWGFIRGQNRCPGCRILEGRDSKKSAYRRTCQIRNCEQFAKSTATFCADGCGRFPCARLKQLDKRYRTKYGMSMIDNLKQINELGARHFAGNESVKWACPECGELLCVHKPTCLSCGYQWR
jgi:hypothetical protein